MDPCELLPQMGLLLDRVLVAHSLGSVADYDWDDACLDGTGVSGYLDGHGFLYGRHADFENEFIFMKKNGQWA